MKADRVDSYIVMALCIAAVAIVSNGWQMIDIIDTAPSAVQKFNIIANGLLGQVSLTLAMVAAVVAGRHMVAQNAQQPAAEPLAATEETELD